MIWVPFRIESAGCFTVSSFLVFVCVFLFGLCLPHECARRLSANLSTSLELLAPGTREGPSAHVAFWSCDLPASLEDIESQCQMISLFEDVFFKHPVLQRFSIAIRASIIQFRTLVGHGTSGAEKGNII